MVVMGDGGKWYLVVMGYVGDEGWYMVVMGAGEG